PPRSGGSGSSTRRTQLQPAGHPQPAVQRRDGGADSVGARAARHAPRYRGGAAHLRQRPEVASSPAPAGHRRGARLGWQPLGPSLRRWLADGPRLLEEDVALPRDQRLAASPSRGPAALSEEVGLLGPLSSLQRHAAAAVRDGLVRSYRGQPA